MDAATADTMPIPAAVDMELLILLAAGAKDQAIARQRGALLRIRGCALASPGRAGDNGQQPHPWDC